MNSAKFRVKFLKKLQRTYDVYSFFFEKPANFEFTAGQYNRWIVPVANPDERGDNRYFTISSAPSEKDLMVTTKISESSFKKALLNLPENQPIEIFGPLGKFTLSDPEIHHVFIAGGIGITPYRSMIIDSANKNLSARISLFASYSTVEDVIFHDELEDVRENHPWFHLYETVTKPEASKTPWPGLTGRINDTLIKSKIPDVASCMLYLCGPPKMIEAMVPIAHSLITDPTHIKVEKFTGY